MRRTIWPALALLLLHSLLAYATPTAPDGAPAGAPAGAPDAAAAVEARARLQLQHHQRRRRPPPPASLRVNCGGPAVHSGGIYWRAERPEELMGITHVFDIASESEVELTNYDAVYRSQRYGTERHSGDSIWGYNFELQPGVYSLTLHFAELYDGVFENGEGPRLFHVAVGDNGRGFQSVQRDVDIYKAVREQENTALTKTFTNLIVSSRLRIRFFPKRLTPVINAISAERIGPLPRHVFRVQVNAGGDPVGSFMGDQKNWVVGPSDTTEVQDEDTRYLLFTDIDGAVHVKQRMSPVKHLTYEVPVPANGVFDVQLLFAENNLNHTGRRVFDIAVGDRNEPKEARRITGFDVFKAAGNKMYTPVEQRFDSVRVPSGTLRITLTAVIENPIISAFVVKRPGQKVFVSTSNPVFNSEAGGYDHQAHAVTGKDVLCVDFDKDGFAVATLDASLSHSHFFEPGPPAVAGRIVEHKWFIHKTNQVIGTTPKISAPFPVGSTVVRLEVKDNTGGKHNDTVTVLALDRDVPGVYAYFYDSRVATDELKPNNGIFRDDAVLPQIGKHLKSLELVDIGDYSWFSFMDLPFQARFLGNITIDNDDEYGFAVDHLFSNPVRLYVDGLYLNLGVAGENTHTTKAYLKKGQHLVEVLFNRTEISSSVFNAMLKVVFYPEKNKKDARIFGYQSTTYDAGLVQPTVHSVIPRASQLNGGGRYRVHGAGFVVEEPDIDGILLRIHNSTTWESDDDGYSEDSDKKGSRDDEEEYRPDAMFFGKNLSDVTTWTMDFTAPKHDKNESLMVSVSTHSGVSNAMSLKYSSTAAQPIRFEETTLVDDKDETFTIARPTSIAVGPDLAIYVGLMEGFVLRLTVDIFTHKVMDKCQSSAPGSNRAVLGLAFNPYDTDPDDIMLYVSTSTLFWKSRGDAHLVGWANGKVQVMKRDVGGFCLGVVWDIVSGLPVSNYDHGINGMTFDSKGNLYVAVGASTNAGVSVPGDALGGVPDSPLSGSIVVAYLSKPGFNGTIRYDRYDDPGKARQISGDVDVFSSGVRNTFDLVHHSSGEIYATSNSANVGFGERSTSCNTQAPVHPNGYADQIIHLQKDSYHGHPNRNRGRFDKRQCVFYSDEYAPEGLNGVFDRPLALVEASTDGIIEYTANTFDFALRGDLFASKFAVGSAGKVYRMKMNATTGAREFNEAEEFHQASGLSLAMLPTGSMVMPQIVEGKVLVLKPEEVVPSGPFITSIFPNRGPLRGGYRVTLTGYNLDGKLHVLFDGVEADDVEVLHKDGRQIVCEVPQGKVTGHITVQVRAKDGALSPSIGKDFEYLSRDDT